MHNQLARKCPACGQVKPLTAFLLHGNTFAEICSDCRARAAEEDAGSGGKGVRVDDRAKNIAEIEQKKREQELKALAKEELEKREKLTSEKKEKNDQLSIYERKQREDVLAVKKVEKPGDTRKAAEERTKEAAIATANLNNRQNQETGQTIKAVEESHRTNTDIDLSNPFNLGIIQDKHNSVVFRRFRQWLGTSAAGMQGFNKPGDAVKADSVKISISSENKTVAKETPKNQSQTTQQTQETQQNKPEAPKQPEPLRFAGTFSQNKSVTPQKNQTPTERIEKTWGPSRKG